MPDIHNSSELQAMVNRAIEKATEDTMNIVIDILETKIKTEFYDQYDPKEYDRTFQFLKSSTGEYLKNTFEVFIDENKMDYEDISGYFQTLNASLGWHGNSFIKTDGRFWESFIEWCDTYLLNVFIEQLSLHGLHFNTAPIF